MIQKELNNYLEKKSANDIEYLVIKTEFSLNYSIFNDMKFSQIRIYFVSKKYDTSLKKEIYEVILSESINDYNLIKEKLKSDKITLYESILFNFKTEIPIYQIQPFIQNICLWGGISYFIRYKKKTAPQRTVLIMNFSIIY